MTAFTNVLRDNEPVMAYDNPDWKIDDVFMQVERFFLMTKAWRDKTLTLDILAEKLGTNRTYVSSAVHKHTHKSVPTYVNTFRIDEAKQIIKANPTIQLKQVASDVGFTTYSTFCTAFKEIADISPNDYKQEVLAEIFRAYKQTNYQPLTNKEQ